MHKEGSYDWGFLLKDKDLRRIAQVCQDHILKKVNVNDFKVRINYALKDGSEGELTKIDEIFDLDNYRSKQIKRLNLTYDDGKEDSDWSIAVSFRDSSSYLFSSINYQIDGQANDWVQVTAYDIEDRLEKVKIFSPTLTFEKLSTGISAYGGLLLVFLVGQTIASPTTAIAQLEKAYKEGLVKDPVEAVLLLEKVKSTTYFSWKSLLMYTLALALPYIVLWLLRRTVLKLYPPYNFYWGDYIAYYQKCENAQNILWTVVVLGILVSIVSTYILRFLPGI